MDRRQTLKTLGLGLGYAVAGPSIIQILASCEGGNKLNWKPLFLSESQGYVLQMIADVILPPDNLPAASAVNTSQFLDLILREVIDVEEQQQFLKGADIFDKHFEVLTGKDVLAGDKFDYKFVIANYFDIEDDESEKVLKMLGEPNRNNDDRYFLYKFLLFVRSYTLFTYSSSEALYDEVNKYNPYSPNFISCISEEEFGV
ncbi:gluconate 2-dehydrogenase subunit 3 family protein [Aestuariibaculum suncheonense]|uniref:Gluconate 2-dehydrogenase subunit 3 family protein n=1 Tax=Aestuariibaculum suncheonense TaxID=1028745 RepID=A0A8J6Q9P8_9FLAO|nr:gluconate 2-dehydrogenase subunit 3 family protein [Aestuariibaculum suncheonense]MBD0836287.1 gluconate 2-dehydrogenase subunit 3 family protein [Aestuariibaculum suncheonense]